MKKQYSVLNLKNLDEAVLEKPIIENLLGTDFYKIAMDGFLWARPELASADMVWRFKNRNESIPLADFVSEEEFMTEYENVKALQANRTELHYLRGTDEYGERMFTERFLTHLQNLAIPDATYSIENKQPIIEVSGPWSHSTHSEINTLKIVNGLYYRNTLKKLSRFEREAIYAEGISRLYKSLQEIKKNPKIKFSDFGNRRSFNPEWHKFVVERSAEELPNQFIGTSNVELAALYGLMPIGTCAHELSMGITALNFNGTRDSIVSSIISLYEMWWNHYGEGLSIGLPDTYGTDFTHSVLPDYMFKDWKGERIDSMDPMIAIPALIKKYESLNIDARNKMAIPSDGLTVKKMIEISEAFADKIKLSFGWGTHLTNNLGLEQLPIVMKPKLINGKACVKLSDNLAKNMGAEAQEYKNVLGDHNAYYKTQIV